MLRQILTAVTVLGMTTQSIAADVSDIVAGTEQTANQAKQEAGQLLGKAEKLASEAKSMDEYQQALVYGKLAYLYYLKSDLKAGYLLKDAAPLIGGATMIFDVGAGTVTAYNAVKNLIKFPYQVVKSVPNPLRINAYKDPVTARLQGEDDARARKANATEVENRKMNNGKSKFSEDQLQAINEASRTGGQVAEREAISFNRMQQVARVRATALYLPRLGIKAVTMGWKQAIGSVFAIGFIATLYKNATGVLMPQSVYEATMASIDNQIDSLDKELLARTKQGK